MFFFIFIFFLYRYNKWSEKVDTYRVVGFEVAPRSIDASSYEEKEGDVCVIDFKTAKRQAVTEKTEQVVFSYDVTWVVSYLFNVLDTYTVLYYALHTNCSSFAEIAFFDMYAG